MVKQMKMRGILIVAVMLSGAFGAGYALGKRPSDQVPASTPAARSAHLGRMRELQARIRALDEQLAQRKRQMAKSEAPQEVETNETAVVAKPELIVRLEDGAMVANLAGSCSPDELVQRLAALKSDDPETFARVETAVREHVDSVADAATDRIKRLSELGAALPEGEARTAHERLIETVGKIASVHAQMNDFSNPSSADPELAEAAAELSEELSSELATERKALLNQLAAELGYAGDDAQTVVDTIEVVVRATEANPEGDQASQLNSVVIAPLE